MGSRFKAYLESVRVVGLSATVTFIRTSLARVVILITCLATLGGYFLVSTDVANVANEINLWNMNITSFTLFIGLFTVFGRYVGSITKREPNWPFHAYCLSLIIIWIIFGTYYGAYSDTYQTAYLSTKITLHITIIGQLIFFSVSAMYRTFRIKSLRTAVFAFLAVTMVVLNAPWLLTPFPVVGNIAFWLLDNPQMAGARAMVLCGGIGGIVLAVRILLGLERGALRATGGE